MELKHNVKLLVIGV